MGPPGIKPDRFAWMISQSLHSDHLRLSFENECKKNILFRALNFSNYSSCFEKFCGILRNELSRLNTEDNENFTIIISGHFTLPEERHDLFSIIKECYPKVDEIIGVWLEADFHYLQKQADKYHEINYDLLHSLFDYRVSPRIEEPFNDIYYLIVTSDIGLNKKYPYISTIKDNLEKLAKECDIHETT